MEESTLVAESQANRHSGVLTAEWIMRDGSGCGETFQQLVHDPLLLSWLSTKEHQKFLLERSFCSLVPGI